VVVNEKEVVTTYCAMEQRNCGKKKSAKLHYDQQVLMEFVDLGES